MTGEKTNIATCASCQTKYKVSDSLLGKKVTCKKCGNEFEVTKHDEIKQYPIVATLAVESGFISKKQLEETLSAQDSEEQSGRNVSLEEILLSKGMISSEQMNLLRAAKQFWEERRLDRQFGTVAVRKGFATQEEVDRVLEEQATEFTETKVSRLIGDMLVDTGALTEKQCDLILTEQKGLEKEIESPDGVSDSSHSPESETKDESALSLTVSEDGVEAYVSIAADLSDSISLEEVKDFLQGSGIKYGIVDDSLIGEFLGHEALQKEGFKIAEGKAPKPGTHASVKYCFDIEHLKVGAAEAGGAIDFKHRGEIPNVKEGDLLVEKMPVEKGEAGIDVYGNPIPAPETRDIRLRCGSGAELAEDGLKVFAKIAGQPKISFGGKISVFPEYKISGDVCLKTGHVDFDGNIRVTGAIQSGFRVKGGNVSAKEILKAEIESIGDVIVTGGIIGARIKARGEVKAKYIEHSTIEAFGDVIAEKEIIGSEILTSGACKVVRGKIMSSVVTARQGIVGADIGTEGSNPCKLKTGAEDHIEKEVKGIKNAISKRKEELEELKSKAHELEQEDQQTHEEIAELAQVQDRATVKQRALTEEIEDLRKKGEQDKADQTENVMKELDAKIRTADEATNKLFGKQDQILKDKSEVQNKSKAIQEEVEELNDEKNGILESARGEEGVCVVKATGSIHAGTTISCAHSSRVLERTFQNVSVKEVRITDTDSEHKWEIRVMQ